MTLCVVVALPAVVAAQKLNAKEIDRRAQRLTSETQKLRSQEREEIQAATRMLLANPRVQRQPQLAEAVRTLERRILASRERADRDLPGELSGLFKLKASGKSAPPIPGKSGSLTGESKANEHYSRETQDTTTAIRQANLQALQDAMQMYEKMIQDSRRKILQQIMKTWNSLLVGGLIDRITL
jgi:soluble lytic murein transglycosylase-like protein